MKSEKSKHRVKEWVEVAKKFGDQCLAIQHDSQLNPEEKLEKQTALSNQIIAEIKQDTELMESEKEKMMEAIKDYMNGWETMNLPIQENTDSTINKKTPPKKKKT